jgi:PAS domain S-box-containing protein
LAAIVEASRDAIWSWTNDGIIISWNGEAERMFGYRAEEILGTSLLKLVPLERVDLAHEAIGKLQTGGWFGQYATQRLRKDGKTIDVELTVSPIRDQTGTTVGGATVCRDVTERKQSEATLSRRVKELSALYKFTDSLHHADSLEVVYRSALDAITSALDCERASILLFDDAGVMHFVAWRGLSEGYRKIVDGHSPWQQNTQNVVPIFVSDIDTSVESDSLKTVIKAEGIRGLAFIPLVVNGHLIGKFMTYYAKPHHFTSDDQHLSITIGRQLAFSVERLRAAVRERTLVRELQHRSNNLLAVIQSIATQTLTSNSDIHQASKVLTDRLQALSRANRQLTNSSWTGLDLSDIVRSELEAFSSRAFIKGPKIFLNPRYAQSFCLALHELATNATKYGALSTPCGEIKVTWSIAEDDPKVLQFRWIERGGPPVFAPTKQGFGTSLLKATFGKANLEYRPEGLHYEIALPLHNIEQDQQA